MGKGDGSIPNQQPEGKREGARPEGQRTPGDLAPGLQVGKLPGAGDHGVAEKNGMSTDNQLLSQATPAELKEAASKFGKATVDALNGMGLSSETFKALLSTGVSAGAVKELVSAGVSGGFLGAFATQFSSANDMTQASDPAMRAFGSRIDSVAAAKDVRAAIDTKDLARLIPANEKVIEHTRLLVKAAEGRLSDYQTKFKKELGSA